MKITCIGTGAMGSAIFRAVCGKFDPKNVTLTNRTASKAESLAREIGCGFRASNREAVRDADYVFVAVKPQSLEAVLAEIKDEIRPEQVIVSMAAGVRLGRLESLAPGARFVRIMPNVGAQVGEGMTALCCGENISEKELDEIRRILSATGKVERIPETLMDCATAVSGSAPAFVFLFAEALSDAAVRCGMPRSQATLCALQTIKGAACLALQTGRHPAELKDSVCSPGGTTIEGVAALERCGFRSAVIEAVSASCKKSAELGK